MGIISMTEGAMMGLVDGITENIGYDNIKRGYELYREGTATGLQLLEGGKLVGYCQKQGNLNRVTLDLDFFMVSSCDCGSSRFCEHIAAVFFKAYAGSGRKPELFFADCTEENKRAEAESYKKSRESLAIRKPEQLKEQQPATVKPASKPTFPKPDDMPESWHRYFQFIYGKSLYTLSGGNNIAPFYMKVTKELFPASAKWYPTIRYLFRLHVIFFAIEKIDEFIINQSKNYFMPYYLSHSVSEVFQLSSRDLDEILSEILAFEARETDLPALLWMRELLSKHAFKQEAYMLDWPGLYRIIWQHLLRNPDWMAEERGYLEAMNGKSLTDNQKDRVQSALAHFDYIDGEDHSTLSRLLSMSSLSISDFDGYLDDLASRGYWSRFLVWLEALRPQLKRSSRYLEEVIFPYWLEGIEAQKSDPAWTAWMESMLPRSQAFYSEYLIRNGQARKVVHMHLSEGYPLWDMDKKLLKLIEQEDIRLVLPLYHQEAERCIMQKNRDAYKQAVRRLKKLASIYKKLRELDRWNTYVEHLTTRYSRLRAFQEELRRGKLIV
jgi:hypothetical protein